MSANIWLDGVYEEKKYKYLHLVTVTMHSEDILENIPSPSVWNVPLENLCVRFYLAQALHPTTLSCT